MKWRTDKPTANVIVALVRFVDENMIGDQITEYHFRALERRADDFYVDYYADAEHISNDRIVKWANLEEDETVTNCHQLEDELKRYQIEDIDRDTTVADVARHFANWQKEQAHYACRQCEKAYDNVFFRGEQHAIKMLKEEAIEGKCVDVGNAGAVIDTDYGCLFLPPESFKVDDMVKVIILRDE